MVEGSHAALCAGELQHTLAIDKLASWVRQMDSKILAVEYFDLDKWMGATVS